MAAAWPSLGPLLAPCGLLVACGGAASLASAAGLPLGASWHQVTGGAAWTLCTAQAVHAAPAHLAANSAALLVCASLLPTGSLGPAGLLSVYLVSGTAGTAASIAYTASRFAPAAERRTAGSIQEFNSRVLRRDAQLRNGIANGLTAPGLSFNLLAAGEPMSRERRRQEMELLAVPERLRARVWALAEQFPQQSTHTLRRILMAAGGSTDAARTTIVKSTTSRMEERVADGPTRDRVDRLVAEYRPYKRWAYESHREVIGGSASVCGLAAAGGVLHARKLAQGAARSWRSPSMAICAGCVLLPVSDLAAIGWGERGGAEGGSRGSTDHVAHFCGWAAGLALSGLAIAAGGLSSSTV